MGAETHYSHGLHSITSTGQLAPAILFIIYFFIEKDGPQSWKIIRNIYLNYTKYRPNLAPTLRVLNLTFLDFPKRYNLKKLGLDHSRFIFEIDISYAMTFSNLKNIRALEILIIVSCFCPK